MTPEAPEGPSDVSGDTVWAEIVVPVGAAHVDDVAALIASEIPAAAAGTEQRGDEVVFWVRRANAVAALAATCEALARWQRGGLPVDPVRVRIATALPEAEWMDAWKKYFHVARLTRQFVVVPSWESFTPEAGDMVIALDPGMAFGTGTHASTRLVLEEIQLIADCGVMPVRVLDVGCGSGILAIAAAKRWPNARCVAIDTDPNAVAATRENAERNRVARQIATASRLGERLDEPFDLVLANIQAHVLRQLRAELIASTAPGGTLILSGLLTPQAEPLANEFVAAGMRSASVQTSTDDPQWSCAVLVR